MSRLYDKFRIMAVRHSTSAGEVLYVETEIARVLSLIEENNKPTDLNTQLMDQLNAMAAAYMQNQPEPVTRLERLVCAVLHQDGRTLGVDGVYEEALKLEARICGADASFDPNEETGAAFDTSKFKNPDGKTPIPEGFVITEFCRVRRKRSKIYGDRLEYAFFNSTENEWYVLYPETKEWERFNPELFNTHWSVIG